MKLEFDTVYSCCPLCENTEVVIDFSVRLEDGTITWNRCKTCDLVFQNPRLAEQTIKAIYTSDAYWRAQDACTTSAYANYMKYEYLRIRQGHNRLKKILHISSLDSGRLLDVGCATGFFGSIAKEHGFQVTGIEPSTQMAAFGRKRYQFDIRCTTLEDIELKDEAYDIVTL
ncbi:MAG: class I SAM-dependent methyltransferase [Desulfobacterales bacterium]|nr:class I SAM-dependent methyltransferase [Desulfobacterales bacterium]MDP6808988.1 class I SAM-dependent methyltransferase [Desulfobacterales bacterium]